MHKSNLFTFHSPLPFGFSTCLRMQSRAYIFVPVAATCCSELEQFIISGRDTTFKVCFSSLSSECGRLRVTVTGACFRKGEPDKTDLQGLWSGDLQKSVYYYTETRSRSRSSGTTCILIYKG